ncbi:MAG: hypothetical protein DRJ40_05915 [Thermoprotei archaeon]|nr:MAG: hypothetical protein DRJ40_05915 [Thermoprotei archaeon]
MPVYYDIHSILTVRSEYPPETLSKVLPPYFITSGASAEKCTDLSIHSLSRLPRIPSEVEGAVVLSRGFLGSGLMVENLEGRARVYLASLRYRVVRKLRPKILRLLFEILEVKLLQKGFTFVHAGCIAHGDEGVMLLAPPNTGKTLTVLWLVLEKKLLFLADDMCVLGPNARALSYPIPLTIHYKHTQVLKGLFSSRLSLSLRVRKYLSKLLLGKLLSSCQEVPPEVIFPQHYFAKECRVSKLVFLELSQMRRVERVRDETIMWRKLVTTAKMHRTHYDTPLLLYFFHRPFIDVTELEERQNELLRSLLDRTEWYLVKGPPDTFAELVARLLE